MNGEAYQSCRKTQSLVQTNIISVPTGTVDSTPISRFKEMFSKEENESRKNTYNLLEEIQQRKALLTGEM